MSTPHRSPVPIPPVRRVLLFPRQDGAAAWPATQRAARALVEAGASVVLPATLVRAGFTCDVPADVLDTDTAEEVARIDLVMVLGGDGTLLRAGRWIAAHGVPIVGVNLGDLGFLAAYGRDDVDAAVNDAIQGRLHWAPRKRMRIRVHRDAQLIATEHACNDVYVKHGEIPRLLRLAVWVSDQYMSTFKADGLIVCTPMGSTAYNLAAGGPIVAPGTDVFTITPICPHSLSHRPVVTHQTETIRIVFEGPADVSSAFLTADGQWNLPLQLGDEVVLDRADEPLRIVPPRASVFEVLARQMGWSGPRGGR